MRKRWWIVGALVLAEVLVCAGIVALAWGARDSIGNVRFFYVADTCIEETIERTFEVDGPVTFDLTGSSDNAVVTGGDEDVVQVTARLHVCGEDEEDARRSVDVQLSQDGNRITVRAVRKPIIGIGIYSGGSRVDFDVRVPTETSVRMETASGDLEVSAVEGSVDLRSASGNVTAEDVAGSVETHTSSGDARLSRVSGAGRVETGSVSGDVELRDVASGDVIASTSSGDLTLADLESAGEVEVGTVSGDVEMERVAAGDLRVHTSSGTIQVTEGTVGGELDLRTTSGRIEATGVQAASYLAHSSSGDLTLEECGGPLDLQTVSGTIEATQGSAAVLDIETSSGSISFAGSLAREGQHRIKSISGSVHLLLPEDAAFDLDIETVSGAIQTEFAVTATELGRRSVSGQVNGGGPLIEIDTTSGSVTLESLAE